MENKKINNTKTFKRMDYFITGMIVDKIVEDCVEFNKINNFMVTIYKEVFLICDQAKYIEPILSEEGVLNIVETFKLIRKDGLFDKFKREFHRDDIKEFEELLQLEINQKVRIWNSEKSLESTIEIFLDNLLAKIPNEATIRNMISEFKGLDEGKLKDVLKLVGK